MWAHPISWFQLLSLCFSVYWLGHLAVTLFKLNRTLKTCGERTKNSIAPYKPSLTASQLLKLHDEKTTRAKQANTRDRL